MITMVFWTLILYEEIKYQFQYFICPLIFYICYMYGGSWKELMVIPEISVKAINFMRWLSCMDFICIGTCREYFMTIWFCLKDLSNGISLDQNMLEMDILQLNSILVQLVSGVLTLYKWFYKCMKAILNVGLMYVPV